MLITKAITVTFMVHSFLSSPSRSKYLFLFSCFFLNFCLWFTEMVKSTLRHVLSLFLFVYLIYPTPPLGQDMTRGQFLSGSLTGFNSEFFFS